MDKVKDRLLLIFILSLILVLRITYISNSPYEQGETGDNLIQNQLHEIF